MNSQVTPLCGRTQVWATYGTSLEGADGVVVEGDVETALCALRGTPLTVNAVVNEDVSVQRLLSLAKECGIEDILYSSENPHVLAEIKRADPAARTAPVFERRILYPWVYASLLDAYAVNPEWGCVFDVAGTVKGCHDRGIKVNVWAPSSPDVIRKLLPMGVDAIITPEPTAARRIIDEWYNA